MHGTGAVWGNGSSGNKGLCSFFTDLKVAFPLGEVKKKENAPTVNLPLFKAEENFRSEWIKMSKVLVACKRKTVSNWDRRGR